MTVLAHVVERIVDDHYSTALDALVLKPLGMRSSSVVPGDPPAAVTSELVAGYASFPGLSIPFPHLYSKVWPATALFTTAPDMTRFLGMVMRADLGSNQELLRPASVRLMLSPYGAGPAPGIDFGLGFQLFSQTSQPQFVGHGGCYPYATWAEARYYRNGTPAQPKPFVAVAFVNSWDMVRYFNAPDRTAVGLVLDFLAESSDVDRGIEGELALDDKRPGLPNSMGSHSTVPTARTSGWSELDSYLKGVFLAERTVALQGLTGSLTSAQVDGMASDAHAQCLSEWHPASFVTGFSEINGLERCFADLSQYLDSRCRVSRPFRDLHALSWGATRAHLRMPYPFFAREHYEGGALRDT